MTALIPVTVLTGFLGSGKTTLLNRILSEQHGLRIAVIENEFGEIGIDQDLVINADQEVFEMNNGCICCTVRGDLIRILGDLAKRKDKFDRVILETTGMADPGPVAQTFFVDEDVRTHYELDGIITLVDAKHVSQHLDNSTDEVLSQLAFADRIIINKADLVSVKEQDTLTRRLQSINGMANVYKATMANAPIEELLDIGGFNLQRALEKKPSFLEPEYPFEWAGSWNLPAGEYRFHMANGPDLTMSIALLGECEPMEESLLTLAEKIFVEFSRPATPLTHGARLVDDRQHYQLILQQRGDYEFTLSLPEPRSIAVFTQHRPEEFDLKLLDARGVEHTFNAGHSHDSAVTSVAIEMPGLFDMSRINAWLDAFLSVHGADVYRMKGVVGVHGQSRRIVFQGVHMIFGSQTGLPWGNEAPINRLVFIGKNLDDGYIRKSLAYCLSRE